MCVCVCASVGEQKQRAETETLASGLLTDDSVCFSPVVSLLKAGRWPDAVRLQRGPQRHRSAPDPLKD